MDTPDEEIPLELRQQVDRLADQFVTEYQAGQQPRIEDYLDRHPELRRPLLRELLAHEVELRLASGEQVSAEDYANRFPEALPLLRALLENTIGPDNGDDADEDEPLVTQYGRYTIESPKEPLGSGGFGIVYRAYDPQLDRTVALKVLRRKWFRNPQQVASFLAEARTAARLKHPGLVAVYDVQEVDGRPYIVQEFIDGPHLGDWAHNHQPSYPQISQILADVAEALRFLHRRGLTHCDLKLANVLMDSEGQPHVADFGLALHESAQAFRRGEVFGTPAMMAPEQVRGETHRLRRSDGHLGNGRNPVRIAGQPPAVYGE